MYYYLTYGFLPYCTRVDVDRGTHRIIDQSVLPANIQREQDRNWPRLRAYLMELNANGILFRYNRYVPKEDTLWNMRLALAPGPRRLRFDAFMNDPRMADLNAVTNHLRQGRYIGLFADNLPMTDFMDVGVARQPVSNRDRRARQVFIDAMWPHLIAERIIVPFIVQNQAWLAGHQLLRDATQRELVTAIVEQYRQYVHMLKSIDMVTADHIPRPFLGQFGIDQHLDRLNPRYTNALIAELEAVWQLYKPPADAAVPPGVFVIVDACVNCERVPKPGTAMRARASRRIFCDVDCQLAHYIKTVKL